MCTVLGVARSTYYKFFDKTKSARQLENEELKAAISRICKANKVRPRIYFIVIKTAAATMQDLILFRKNSV